MDGSLFFISYSITLFAPPLFLFSFFRTKSLISATVDLKLETFRFAKQFWLAIGYLLTEFYSSIPFRKKRMGNV